MRSIRKALVALALVMSTATLAGTLLSCVTTDYSEDEPEQDSLLATGVKLAIFDFDVRSSMPGFEALSVDVPSALAEAFIAGGIVKPVEREALQKVLGELELSMSGLVDPGTAAKVGRMAGARYVLLGTAAVVGEQVRLSCRVVDVETSEIVYAGSAYGNAEEIFDIEAELAELVEGDFSE